MRMQHLILTTCAVIAVFLPARSCNVTEKPIVGIEMSDAGMHRELLYTVQFDYPLAGKDCEYVLEQHLPAAVYVSVDQLDDLKRLKKLTAIYPQFVDIEVPTDKAEPFTVHLLGVPKTTDSFALPIHFRYHAPSAKESFAEVDIAIPSMYMRCPDSDNDLIDNGIQATPSIKYCLKEQPNSMVEYDGQTDAYIVDDEACAWKLMNVDYQPKASLRAKIPVGDEKSFPPVLYATIVISWIVSLWTVFRTNSVPRRINQKLEEQRVLQHKIK